MSNYVICPLSGVAAILISGCTLRTEPAGIQQQPHLRLVEYRGYVPRRIWHDSTGAEFASQNTAEYRIMFVYETELMVTASST